MKNKKIINIVPRKDYRIVAISDIHGHGDHLRKLIEKVQLQDEDYLVIVGDFINRGRNSLDSLSYVRELGKRKNTIVLKGNHEFFIHFHMENLQGFKELYKILTKVKYETLIQTLCGQDYHALEDDLEKMYNYLVRYHKEKFDYLKDLPIMATIGEFRFVHGGYQENFNVDLCEVDYLKYDDFNEDSQVNDKVTIVGHWPTSNLRHDCILNRPYFNDEKNIIFIDGALGVKKTGELNGLIINSNNGLVSYDCIQITPFKKAKIVKSHLFTNSDKIYVNYPHCDVEVIRTGGHMTLCKHTYSGKEFNVFNSLLRKNGDKYQLITNYVNNFINLSIGDEVYVCHKYKDCVLVKYKEEFGWINRNQISE